MHQVGHQSVISPLSDPPVEYCESGDLWADRDWIHSNVAKFGDTRHLTTLSIHTLGGITTVPKIKTAFLRFKTQGLLKGFSEIIKLFFFVTLGRNLYYKFLFRQKSYPLITSFQRRGN